MATPCIRFTLGSHIQFGSLDFPLLSTSTSSLRPCPTFTLAPTRGRPLRTTGQEVPKADRRRPVSRTTTGKARGQSSTTVHLNPYAGEIPTDMPTHHAQAIAEVLVTTETTSSTSSDEDDENWAGTDLSGLDDSGGFTSFRRHL
jgi:hypothetical protein